MSLMSLAVEALAQLPQHLLAPSPQQQYSSSSPYLLRFQAVPENTVDTQCQKTQLTLRMLSPIQRTSQVNHKF